MLPLSALEEHKCVQKPTEEEASAAHERIAVGLSEAADSLCHSQNKHPRSSGGSAVAHPCHTACEKFLIQSLHLQLTRPGVGAVEDLTQNFGQLLPVLE